MKNLMLIAALILITGCKEAAPVSNITDDPAARCPTCQSDEIDKIRALVFEKSPEMYDLLSDREELALKLVSFVHHNTALIAGNTVFDTVDRAENLRLILTDPTYGLEAGGMAITAVDVLTVFGYNARTVQMFSNGVHKHVAIEVYLNGRWVAIDPMFNVVFTVNAEPIDYKSMFDLWRDHQQLPQAEVIDTTLRRVEDYSIPYSTVLFQGRRLPVRTRILPALNVLVLGQETF